MELFTDMSKEKYLIWKQATDSVFSKCELTLSSSKFLYITIKSFRKIVSFILQST